MALATRCPHCHTAFRVVEDQLKLYSGIVRCGVCQQAFNGADHLVDESVIAAKHAPASDSQSTSGETVEKPADLPQDGSPADSEHIEVDIPAQSFGELYHALVGSPGEEIPATVSEDKSNSFDDSRLPQLDDLSAETAEEEWPVLSLDLGDNLSDNTNPANPPSSSTEPFTLEESEWIDKDEINSLILDTHEQEEPVAEIPQADTVDITVPQEDEAPEPDIPLFSQAEADAYLLARNAAAKADEDLSGLNTGELRTDEKHEPGFLKRARRKQKASRIVRVMLGLGSFVLLLLLAAQAVYAFHERIVLSLPQAEPIVAEVCGIIECETHLSAKIDELSIDSSELQSLPNRPNTFSLDLVLHNNSTSLQAWPSIELTLNNESGQPVVRRVLAPEEYLADLPASANEKNTANGFSAQSEQPVKLVFTVDQVKAAGYRIYLFYP